MYNFSPAMWWTLGFLVLGIVARTFVPYLQVLRENPDVKFDKKYLLPAATSLALNLLLLPLMLTTDTFSQGWRAAFLTGWGVQDIVRQLMKGVGQNFSKLSWMN